ncbi:MAG: S8 family serine peptidase [Oscillospiraceae bacterium]|nr:S8 family serine peptidase [Oscillospiraceae bacterium]
MFFNNKLSSDLRFALNNGMTSLERIIVHFKFESKPLLEQISKNKIKILYFFPRINLICLKADAKIINALLEFPQVDYMFFDEIGEINPLISIDSGKNFKYIKSPLTGKGISVGIVSTGIHPHDDLVKPINRIYYFLDLINSFSFPYDDNGQGSFLAGIISSSGCSSEDAVKGVASDSNICMVKAFDKMGKGYFSTVLWAMVKLLSLSNEYNMKVILLPFEFKSTNPIIFKSFEAIIEKLNKKNIIVVSAQSTINAGPSLPSSIEKCICISSINNSKNFLRGYKKPYIKPDFYLYGENYVSLCTNEFFIPERNGKKIYSKRIKDKYRSYTGNSCAAAYTAGLIARLKQEIPDLNYKDVHGLLRLNSEKITDPLKYGYGVITSLRINNLSTKE